VWRKIHPLSYFIAFVRGTGLNFLPFWPSTLVQRALKRFCLTLNCNCYFERDFTHCAIGKELRPNLLFTFNPFTAQTSEKSEKNKHNFYHERDCLFTMRVTRVVYFTLFSFSLHCTEFSLQEMITLSRGEILHLLMLVVMC
jgi:hypothetical protein